VSDHSGALEALDRILNRGGDADDVLRQVVGVLANRYEHVTIRFVEGDALVDGPSAGAPAAETATWQIDFRGTTVGELAAGPASDLDGEFLRRVATLISPFCLVGWDTGGSRWEP
jgi:hypothetical protein